MVVVLKEATMNLDVDTFLTTVYCLLDDLYRSHYAPHKPARPGKRPKLSDSEVITVLLVAQWQHDRSERALLRYACRHWRAYFPRLLSQSAFNRRTRALVGLLSHLGPLLARHLAQTLALAPAYQVLDTAPVPLLRRCRGARHRLFGVEADLGHGGSDDEWYYGMQLLAVVTPAGLITGFVVGPASTDERWLAEALLRWRQDPTAPAPTAAALAAALGPSHRRGGQRRGPTGPLLPELGAGVPEAAPYLGDLGFRGAAWRAHWQAAYGATVLTKADYAALPPADRRRAGRWLSGRRQVVETVNGRLDATFGLKFPRARTQTGVLTRLAAKVAACNLSIYLNHLTHQPPFAVCNPLTA
jgi:hypothetical protein